jgi:hypothetical protein
MQDGEIMDYPGGFDLLHGVCAQNMPEVMDFALILQFSDFVHRRNSTIHPVLSTIRHKQKNRLIINVYFRRPIYNDKP